MSKKAMAKIVEINKQELSTEKVELGIDDYQKYSEEAFSIRKKIEAEVSQYASLSKKLIEIRKNAGRLSVQSSQIQKQAEAQANKDVKAARELGVDPAIIMKPFRQVEKDVDGNIAITERLIKRLANIK